MASGPLDLELLMVVRRPWVPQVFFISGYSLGLDCYRSGKRERGLRQERWSQEPGNKSHTYNPALRS